MSSTTTTATTASTATYIESPLASAAAQKELKGIMNFRDLGESAGTSPDGTMYMRTGLIFRSATLDGASEADIRLLIERYKLMTIVDLRSGIEKNPNKKAVEMNFPTAVLWHINPGDLVAFNQKSPDNVQETRRRHVASSEPESPDPSVTPAADTAVDTVKVESEIVHGRRTYKIDFAGKNFQRRCVWNQCPTSVKAQALALMLFCQKPRAIRLIGQKVMSPRGLTGMYEDFVEGCREEIAETLKIFADRQNYPILVHCTQGKDRTGLTSALLLSIMGVPEELVARDYARSSHGLEPVYRETVEYMAKAGLGPQFADAPEEAIFHVLHHITFKYGSVAAYLTDIGFDEIWQERVRRILAPGEERAQAVSV